MMARLVVLLFVSILLAGGCTEEAPQPEDDDLRESTATASAEGDGTFGVVQMGHTAHDFAEDARAWNGTEEGRFAYVSAPCSADAPVNNNATNLPTLNARLPGSTSPASTRMHPFEFEVVSIEGAGELEGTMSMTVCQLESGSTPEDDPTPDAEKDRIVFEWTATFQRTSEEETVFDGQFEIEEGTGRYQGMTGSGSLHGYFTCAYVPEDCAEAGALTDVMLFMSGTYGHPEIDS